MMEFDNFCFASLPGTEQPFLDMAAAAGVQGTGPCWEPPPADYHSKLKVAVVQHPVHWLAEWWAKPAAGYTWWREVEPLMRLATLTHSGGFTTFVRKYLAEAAGAVSQALAVYAPDTCLRYEDMPWAAIEFFMSLGISRELLVNRMPAVVHHGKKPELSADLWRAVIQAEPDYSLAYNYF